MKTSDSCKIQVNISVKAEKPTVSVVIPLYNKEDEVKRAVDSVLKQTVSDFEIVVVNDGSTDTGPEVVRKYNDSRIRIIDQENSGVSAARNRGIQESQTDLIAFLDADDEWKPTFLETILNLKKKFPTAGVFATNYLFREVNGKYRLPIIRGIPPHPWEGILEDYFDVAAKSDPPLWTSAVSVSKEAIRSVGLFPIGIHSGEDLLTWVRLAHKYKIAYTTKTCATFFMPGDVFDRPGRFNDTTDFVGKEMIHLLTEAIPSKISSLNKYITLWHKNRTVTFLSLGQNQKAMQELRLMTSFSNKNVKWLLYALLANLPIKLSKLFMKYLRTGRRLHRTIIRQ